MNFAEPSGSSPPEKPPGIMTIWLSRMAAARAAMLSATASGVKLFTISVVGRAPARSNACAVSYSQFVPGNTGMMTRGFAIEPLYVSGSLSSHVMGATSVALDSDWAAALRYGNTDSIAPSHTSCKRARSTLSPATEST